jgi:hypothetical protein
MFMSVGAKERTNGRKKELDFGSGRFCLVTASVLYSTVQGLTGKQWYQEKDCICKICLLSFSIHKSSNSKRKPEYSILTLGMVKNLCNWIW